MASGGKEARVIMWDLQDGSKLYDIPTLSSVNAVAFNPSKYWIAMATDVGIEVWDLEDKTQIFVEHAPPLAEHIPWATCLVWSVFPSCNECLFVGHSDGTITQYRVACTWMRFSFDFAEKHGRLDGGKNLEEPSKWFVCVNPGYIILRQDNPTMCCQLSVLLIFCVIIRITPLCYVFVLWTLQSSEFRSSFVLKASRFCLLRSYRFRHLLRQYAGLLFNSSREARGCAPFSQLGWVVQWSMAFELIQQMEPDDESLEKEMSWKSSFSFSIG